MKTSLLLRTSLDNNRDVEFKEFALGAESQVHNIIHIMYHASNLSLSLSVITWLSTILLNLYTLGLC